ncbi:MAG TPA: iron-containing alcohol dehydrogenase, partial [Thermosynergistes sp.]|nr:iron-containing alcohol dehydrogenase [Thermosynergistes sp.]
MDLEGLKDKARRLLLEFKGENYAFGLGVLKMAGEFGASFGKSALVISNATHIKSVASVVVESLQA